MFKRLSALNRKQILLTALFSYAIISFVLYGNTLKHDYALDDAIVITKNEFTKQGLFGIKDILTTDSFTGFFGKQKKLVEGGRYRPLSLVLFAIEYDLFGENPFVGHLFNILWYGLLCWLVWILFYKLFELWGVKNALLYACIGSVWFAIHPIHTEAVANIKGRDEILSLFFSVLSFIAVLLAKQNRRSLHLVLSGVFMFLACMAKENAISFVLIIPLALYFIRDKDQTGVLKVFVALLLPAIVFVIIRNKVLGGFSFAEVSELMNNPFVNASFAERYATILFTWLIYFKLLIFPHPLTFDYYPHHIQLHTFAEPVVWLAILMVAIILWSIIRNLTKKSLVSFSLLGFVLSFSIVSNVFFPVGIFMNERFVFMPSLFVAFLFAYGVGALLNKLNERFINKAALVIVLLYFVGFYPLKTIARNLDWKDDLTLFLADVKTSENSAKSNCSAGGKLWEKGKVVDDEVEKKRLFTQSEKYLRKALEVYPDYSDAWLLLGNLLYDAHKDIEGSAEAYLAVIERQPGNKNAWNNIDIVLQQSSDRNLQLEYYSTLNKKSPNKFQPNYRLGVMFGRYFGDLKKGIYYLERAVAINNKSIEAIKDLGTAYGIAGEKQKAYEQFSRAVRIDSTDIQLLINMSVVSRELGEFEEAERYHLKIEQLK